MQHWRLCKTNDGQHANIFHVLLMLDEWWMSEWEFAVGFYSWRYILYCKLLIAISRMLFIKLFHLIENGPSITNSSTKLINWFVACCKWRTYLSVCVAAECIFLSPVINQRLSMDWTENNILVHRLILLSGVNQQNWSCPAAHIYSLELRHNLGNLLLFICKNAQSSDAVDV